jgi:hypothetical protein
MAIRKSVPRPAPGSGAPRGKNPILKFFYVSDIVSLPNSDSTGVRTVGNIVMKEGTAPIDFYATDDMQKFSHSIDGEADAEGFLKKIEASHPGDSVDVNEFMQKSLGEGFIVLYPNDCEASQYKMMGTKCNPLYIKGGDFMDDKDGIKHTITFEQRRRDRNVAKFYQGVIPTATPYSPTTFALDLNVNRLIVQLPASNDEENVLTFPGLDFPENSAITLIGGGGSDPITLASMTGSPVGGTPSFLLKNGTSWVALEGAVIQLEGFSTQPGVNFFKEISRA